MAGRWTHYSIRILASEMDNEMDNEMGPTEWEEQYEMREGAQGRGERCRAGKEDFQSRGFVVVVDASVYEYEYEYVCA